MVDDAHGTGVIGEQGRGSCWLQKVKPELLVVTFGKGFGVSGAAVLCSSTVADYLLHSPAIYLQHQYAARSGAGITCVAGGHSQ